MIERFGYSSAMQVPRVEKITLNMGVGDAKQDSKSLKAAQDQLATIAGQQPSIRRARKSIAAFKLREGMPVGVAVTLRGERAYEFLDRLVSIAIPRIRDFRGLYSRSFDGRGNYSMGVREQIIFPEIDYDTIDQVRGLDITITTSAPTDVEAFALLSALGMPFSTYNRPAEFDQGDAADATDSDDDAAASAGSERETAASVDSAQETGAADSADSDQGADSADADQGADATDSADADQGADATASADSDQGAGAADSADSDQGATAADSADSDQEGTD